MVDQLDNHIGSMSKLVSKPIKSKHVCGMCQKGFTSKENLDKHIDAAHQLPRFKCNKCPRQYTMKQNLGEHIMTKHLDKRYECRIDDKCQEKFTRQDLRNYHEMGHKGQYKYVCKECCQGFYHPQQFKGHMNKHRNLKPYKCGVCDTSFTFPTDLPQHLHIHSEGDTRYDCPQKGCNESFATARYLEQHFRGFHKKVKPTYALHVAKCYGTVPP